MNQKERISLANYIVDLDKRPNIPSGWQLLSENYKNGKWKFDHDEIELLKLVNPKNRHKYVGDNVEEWLKKGAIPFNANLIDFFMEHKELIPGPWELEEEIVFIGTMYRHNKGFCCYRSMKYVNDDWYSSCHWCGSPFQKFRMIPWFLPKIEE